MLLADDTQIETAATELTRLLPLSQFRTLPTVPGRGVRAGSYAAAVGDPGLSGHTRS